MTSTQIHLPDSWIYLEEEDGSVVFGNDCGDRLEVSHCDMRPNIGANIDDEPALWTIYQSVAESSEVSLLEAAPSTLGGLPTVRLLIKIARPVHGFTYIGSHTLPFSNDSFVVKVQCEETGTTGVRESLVTVLADRWGQRESAQAWAKDPVDPSHHSPFMRSESDSPLYDEHFPDHPLSRTRRYLDELSRTCGLDPELRSQAPFLFEVSPPMDSGRLDRPHSVPAAEAPDGPSDVRAARREGPRCCACRAEISFAESLAMWNPWRVQCPRCGAALQMSSLVKACTILAFPVGLIFAAVPIYMEESKRWVPAQSLLYLAATAAILIGIGYFVWPSFKLLPRENRVP